MRISVIIAVKHQGSVWMGTDSLTTLGDRKIVSRLPVNHKIWHVNGRENLLMGSVGRVREKNLMMTRSDLFDDMKCRKHEIDHAYLVNALIPKMFKVVQGNKEETVERLENHYLLGVEDTLYFIAEDGAVLEIDELFAIGTGAAEAMSLFRSARECGIEERIKMAVEAAIQNEMRVDYPIILKRTGSTKILTMERK